MELVGVFWLKGFMWQRELPSLLAVVFCDPHLGISQDTLVRAHSGEPVHPVGGAGFICMFDLTCVTEKS